MLLPRRETDDFSRHQGKKECSSSSRDSSSGCCRNMSIVCVSDAMCGCSHAVVVGWPLLSCCGACSFVHLLRVILLFDSPLFSLLEGVCLSVEPPQAIRHRHSHEILPRKGIFFVCCALGHMPVVGRSTNAGIICTRRLLLLWTREGSLKYD